jgi:UDP-N-acetylglucosamine 2-epimerase (non-hydrolysing)
MKVVVVAGARPNFMKVAPLMWEMRSRPGLESYLVHTGQHYDEKMSRLFFEQLRIPRPDIDLGVGSGSHAVQTAEVMRRFEPVVVEQKPDVVLVVGDVNSTIACALTAVKLGARVAHVEAGLRSFDRTMPEEVNRILTDAISDWLFVTEPAGVANLRREGVDEAKIHLVGNVMIDTLLACRARAEESPILEELGLSGKPYSVLTLHRPSNVDDPATFRRLFGAVQRLAREAPVVFPVHPRTRKSIAAIGAEGSPGVVLTEPLGYLDFLKLVARSRLVLTDSGGIQEETTVLGVPCLTLRQNTERPVTCEQGTNQLVGLDPGAIVAAGQRVLSSGMAAPRIPEGWDGQAARRIVDILSRG